MSQNPGKPWQNAENKAKIAPGKLAAAQKSLAEGKDAKQAGLAKAQRAKDNAPNLPGWANASNEANAKKAISTAKTQISQAKQDIKANTRTGPTIGARPPVQTAKLGPTELGAAKLSNKTQTVKLGPTELGSAKLKPQSTSLGSKQLGAAKTPQFKQASPSNPMGRTGGKPGVNIGNHKR